MNDVKDVKITVKSQPVEVECDRGRDWRARIGFVLIPTDGIIEREMTQYAPPGVGMHFTRLPGSEDITVYNLLEMEEGLENAASRFVFDGDLLNVMCFACTSASALIGEERVNEALISSRAGLSAGLGGADHQPETRRQNDSAGKYDHSCTGGYLG